MSTNIGAGTSNSSSGDQQTHEGQSSGKLLTQAEYAKYKQENSNANNYFGYNREATTLPVCWDGKFAYDPNNVRILPNRNASNVNSFYGFCNEPDIRPVCW